jgi:hypothetical protein
MKSKKLAFLVGVFLLLVGSLPCIAQQAQVHVAVKPPEAYIFLDGVGVGHDNHTLKLTPGKHTIAVYNYGFKPFVKEIDATDGMKTRVEAFLEPDGGGQVSGPWGVLQIEGANKAAVLLNGKTPEYFVGHGDEMNNHIWNRQQLILPVGTYDLTVNDKGRELFSGPVKIERNQRLQLYVDRHGEQVVRLWGDGIHINPQPRFKAGIASATIAVAPVSGAIESNPTAINCNDTVTISWKTAETRHAYLTAEPYVLPETQWGLNTKIQLPPATTEEVPLTGTKDFHPIVSTKYTLRSPGPGGVVLQSVIVPVNATVHASLQSTEQPVHIVKVGDNVLHHDATTLNWTVNNADKITIDEIGDVTAVPAKQTVGERSFSPGPKQTHAGPVDETQVYQMTASNVCGGSDTARTTVHVVGDTEPSIASVFFPTAYPNQEHPSIGLMFSEKMQLVPVARVFKLYAEHEPNATLVLTGYTDPRSSNSSNMKLSQRRAERVRAFLIDLGVPAHSIRVEFKGEQQLLDTNAVNQLEATNASPAAAERAKAQRDTEWAYNRRVDLSITPAGIDSVKAYPHDVDGSDLIFTPRRQPIQAIEAKQ